MRPRLLLLAALVAGSTWSCREAAAPRARVFAAASLTVAFGELADLRFAAFQVGADLFADESASEAFEFDGGFVIGAAFGIAVAVGLAHGAKAFEHAQALAGGSFADIEALDEIVE